MSKQSDIRFEEPPPERRAPYDWDRIAAKLRRKPGQWATIFDRDRVSIVNAIRQGGIRVLAPEKGFEARTSHTVKADPEAGIPRLCTLHLRYNPEKDRSN